ARLAQGDGDAARQAVRAGPAGEQVRQALEPPVLAREVHSRRRALARRLLRGRVLRGQRRARDRRLAVAGGILPADDALDPHGDEHAVGGVGAQPAVPERTAARFSHEPFGGGPERSFQVLAVGLGLIARDALYEHEVALAGEAVLAGVVGERDAGV